jgi:hypothetical protein
MAVTCGWDTGIIKKPEIEKGLKSWHSMHVFRPEKGARNENDADG